MGFALKRAINVESSWHCRHQSSPDKRLMPGRTGQKIEVIAYAGKAMRKLQKNMQKCHIKVN
jgi:hypothetical protein